MSLECRGTWNRWLRHEQQQQGQTTAQGTSVAQNLEKEIFVLHKILGDISTTYDGRTFWENWLRTPASDACGRCDGGRMAWHGDANCSLLSVTCWQRTPELATGLYTHTCITIFYIVVLSYWSTQTCTCTKVHIHVYIYIYIYIYNNFLRSRFILLKYSDDGKWRK